MKECNIPRYKHLYKYVLQFHELVQTCFLKFSFIFSYCKHYQTTLGPKNSLATHDKFEFKLASHFKCKLELKVFFFFIYKNCRITFNAKNSSTTHHEPKLFGFWTTFDTKSNLVVHEEQSLSLGPICD